MLLSQFVAESLKAALLAVNLAGGLEAASPHNGETAQASLLRVLVPALVEVAAPCGAPSPLLADTAVKLLTHLAASPAAPAFRAATSALPAEAKQRLQAALQQAAAGTAQEQQQAAAAAAERQAASSGPMQRATIKLNFAAFKK